MTLRSAYASKIEDGEQGQVMILNYYNDLVFAPSELFLNKDFGQVATVLGAIHDRPVEHVIACNRPNVHLKAFNGAQVVQAEKNLKFLPRSLDFLKNIRVYTHILKQRRRYTAMVLFPFWPPSDYIAVAIFRFLNPNAKIILKLDANVDNVRRLDVSCRNARHNVLRQHFYYRKLLETADAVIYETRAVGQLLHQSRLLIGAHRKKLVNVYNGISRQQALRYETRHVPNEYRDNIIIFSGRLSSAQKNVELIFQADPVPPGWKIRFIGAVDQAFRAVIDRYKRQDPQFEEKYEFIGEVTDKKEYFAEFSKGRILILSSAWEGFPMIFAEAHHFGLYIITTDVSGAAEATDEGRLGRIVPRNDPHALREAVRETCANPDLPRMVSAARPYGQRYFVWEDSLNLPILNQLFAPNHE